MKRFVVRKRTLLAGIVVAAGLCAGVAGAGAETQDVAAVRQVFQESQVAQQTLDIAPGLASAASGSGTGVSATAISAALSDNTMNGWHADINSRLQELYAGSHVAQIQQVMNSHATEQQDRSSREIGGGVSSIQFRTLSVRGDTATVVARVAKWLEWANLDRQGRVATSIVRGVVNFQDTFAKTPGGWRITDEKFLSFGDNGATGP